MADYLSSVKMQFALNKRESNLASHLRWLKYLTSKEFIEDWRKRSQNVTQQRALINIARQVIEEDIYSISKGQGNSGRSFKTSPKEGIGLTLYSDPAVAPSEAGLNKGSYSYLAFFEHPERWKSFIKSPNSNPLDESRYRPFFKHLTQMVQDYTVKQAVPVVNKTIAARMPTHKE